MPTLKVSVDISVSSRVKFRRMIGTCNRCGICCVRLIDWRMAQADPDNPKLIKRGQQACVYLDGKPGVGKTTTCLITSGSVDIETVPAFHKKYYLEECITFPNRDKDGHWGGVGGRPIDIDDVCVFVRAVLTQD